MSWTQLTNHTPPNNLDSNFFNMYATFIDNIGIQHGKCSEESILYINIKMTGIWASLQHLLANHLFTYTGTRLSVAPVPGIPPMCIPKEVNERQMAYVTHHQNLCSLLQQCRTFELHTLQYPLPQDDQSVIIESGICALIPHA
jgi:hypothetical protein